MQYHAPILALLALATSVYAELDPFDLGFSPFPKPLLSVGSIASADSLGFVPFGARIPASLHKRQVCAIAGTYKCPNDDSCCPNDYDCESDGVQSYCCPTGQLCVGGELVCAAGTTDCKPINGGDGCCPTDTTYCYQSSSGEYGCMKRNSDSSGGNRVCTQAGYYLCEDETKCCKRGTTCVPGQMYCQPECNNGYTECLGRCCPSGYQCDTIRENCRKTRGGGSRLSESSTARGSTSSRVRRTSSTTGFATPTASEAADNTLSMETPSSTEEILATEETSATEFPNSTSASTTRSEAPTSTEAQSTAIGANGGSGVRVPVLFGLIVIGMSAVVRL